MFPKLKTVGITGSYGKSTTKELLYQVLSQKYKVIKTPKNYNTAVGVATAINELLRDDTEIFIAEIGAYKIGEIKEATDLVPLDIAIVTGIEGQHLSLFGNMQNLVKAKFEIIEGLKDDGIAILNGDNEYCIRMAGKTNHTKVLYFTINNDEKIINNNPEEEATEAEHQRMYSESHDKNIYASKIKSDKDNISFELSFDGNKFLINANIVGIHNVQNLLAVIATCVKLGIDIQDVVNIINQTKFKVSYLNKIKSFNGATIIDDGYNVSHKGFIAGLDYLNQQETKGKKWVLTQGIIELGSARIPIYKDLVTDLIVKSDGIITNDKDLIKLIQNKKEDYKIIQFKDQNEIPKIITSHVTIDDNILLEGALSDDVLKIIKCNS